MAFLMPTERHAMNWLPGAERESQPNAVALNKDLPPRVVWHITWDRQDAGGNQPPFDNVATYLKNTKYCPHLMWDPVTGRTVQYYPAGVGSRALRAWNEDGAQNIQIEVYFSPNAVREGKRYATVADTPTNGLERILAWTDSFWIPRVWPVGEPDWTGNRRDPDIWNGNAGHYGHCQVPDNTNSDPGPMPSIAGPPSLALLIPDLEGVHLP